MRRLALCQRCILHEHPSWCDLRAGREGPVLKKDEAVSHAHDAVMALARSVLMFWTSVAFAVQILMKAMIKCGCQSWLPADHESSLPMHLETMSALIRSRDEEVEAIKSKCKQQAEDARLAKWVQRQEQSKAQIQAAEEAQALRAAEEAQKRKDAADARQAREMRRVKEHQEALKRKTEQLAKREAAKKAKATEAAGSDAGKAIPQAPPEQMGSLGWISCLVPGGMLQVSSDLSGSIGVWTSQHASVLCMMHFQKAYSPCI